jgi:hypothetical protein
MSTVHSTKRAGTSGAPLAEFESLSFSSQGQVEEKGRAKVEKIVPLSVLMVRKKRISGAGSTS